MATAQPGAAEPTPMYNPFEPGFVENPYAQYERLRRLDPIHRSPLGALVLTRYDDIQAILRDGRSSSEELWDSDIREAALRAAGLWERWQESVVPSTIANVLLFRDPPDHTRLRSLVSKVFTPRRVEQLRPRIQGIVDDLLDGVGGSGEMEVIADLAFPMPALVICELLGVPADDQAELGSWSGAATRLLDPMMGPDEFTAADHALRRLLDYFDALVDERRQRPRPDLLSSLIAAEEGGERLSKDELLTLAVLLFAAGHETTKNLIANGILILLREPSELARLRADRSLVPGAVEELLRVESPVQMVARKAVDEMDPAGLSIAAGERLVLLIGAANRDPARFTDPDRVDIGRTDNRPISFGSGIHFCLGAALARLEAQVAFASLLERFGTWELVEEPRWRLSLALRSLQGLRVKLG